MFIHSPVLYRPFSLRSSAICLIHFAHFKNLITCDTQKQGPTLPHVYFTHLLFAEVHNIEVAIRMQDRPHSHFFNLALHSILHIGNPSFVKSQNRTKKKKGSDFRTLRLSFFIEVVDISIVADRVYPDYSI